MSLEKEMLEAVIVLLDEEARECRREINRLKSENIRLQSTNQRLNLQLLTHKEKRSADHFFFDDINHDVAALKNSLEHLCDTVEKWQLK